MFLNTIVDPYRLRRTVSLYVKRCSSTMFQFWDHFREPPVDEDKVRIRWTCRCGTKLWDDFKELIPGAAEHLCQNLDIKRKTAERLQHSPSGAQQPSTVQSPPGGQLMRVSSGPLTTVSVNTPPGSALGNSQQLMGTTTATTEIEQPPGHSPNKDERFLLLCISRKNDTLRLLQLNVEHIKSDFSLFRLLQTTYRDHQGAVARYFSPRKLLSINFRKV